MSPVEHRNVYYHLGPLVDVVQSGLVQTSLQRRWKMYSLNNMRGFTKMKAGKSAGTVIWQLV